MRGERRKIMSGRGFKFQGSLARTSTRGMSLLEILLALGVVAMVLVAMVKIAVLSVGSSTYARQQAVATRYATEGLEWVRSQRDRLGWDLFYDKISSRSFGYCLSTLDWNGGEPSEGSATPCGAGVITVVGGDSEFTRYLMVEVITANDSVEVVSKVSWNDSRGTHASQATQRITRWQSR